MEALYTTIGLLVVSTMTGLCFLAVKYPLTYNVFGKFLLYAVFGFGLLAFAFTIGAVFGIFSVRELVSPDKMKAAFYVSTDIQNVSALVALGCIAFAAFVWLLAMISKHIYESKGGKDDKGGEGE